MKIRTPYLFALITILIWSFGGTFLKLILNKNHFLSYNISYFFGALTFLIIGIKEQNGIVNFLNSLKQFTVKDYLFSTTGYFFYYLFYDFTFRSFNNQVSLSMVLNYTWPLFTYIFINFLIIKKKIRFENLFEIIGLLICLLGIFFLAHEGTFQVSNLSNPLGIFYGLLTGVSYAAFSAYSYNLKIEKITAFMFISIVVALILNIIMTTSTTGIHFDNFTYQDLFWCIIFGVLIDGLGYYFWGKAKSMANQRNLDISPITSMTFVLPLFSLLLISLFFDEPAVHKKWFWVSFGLVFLGNTTIRFSTVILRSISRMLLSENK